MVAIGIDNYPEPKISGILGYFEEIKGIEGENILETNNEENGPAIKCKLSLLRGKDFVAFEKNLEKAVIENKNSGFYIYFIDNRGEIKLQYFLYLPEIAEVQNLQNDYFNTTLTCYLHKASKGVLEAFKMRINKKLSGHNMWAKLKPESRQGWLEVALNLQRDIVDIENLEVEINGELIDDIDSFFCTLGESINGPGGYFGRNLNALDDCFSGDFGVRLPFKLIWRHHLKSKKKLNKDYDLIIQTLNDNGVNIELK